MLRPWWQRGRDLALALLFFGVTVIQVVTDSGLDAAERVGACAVAAGLAAAIWQRRAAPILVPAATLVAVLLRPLVPAAGDGVSYGLAACIAAYTCALMLEGRQLWIGAALTAATPLVLMLSEGWDFAGLLFMALLFGTPWVAGRVIRLSRQRQALLEDQAVLLERQRDEQARIAVVDERQRIARELHDVVAHAISVVVLQARGGRRHVETDPEAAHEAFDAIESTGTQALDEMRRLLGLLRDEEDYSRRPQPTLARVDELAAELRASGLPVEISLEGAPAGVPPGVDVSAYRIVQEALTNALKHAGPARAHVRVSYEEDSVLVEVTDDGVGAHAVVPGGGHGLVGIRERVAIVGGELRAGPRPSGGYAVSARLPYAVER